MSKTSKKNPSAVPKTSRHATLCTICSHPQRDEIEAEVISWASASALAERYHLGSRHSVYRHAFRLLCT